ncbi:TRAP transporter small permease [Pseudoruegeria sp. SHC-113]|uniref:TRAP transporter small permease n=1 Tax=Pseudoruegeria sp. SHC-113 TaxID=2855439 RepID=UPI0021BAB966|nr:TRAP transporter small permease [Pseudoruegeria sp. SHC-113]MCT8162135.1 TRAP transporter small permease [Pseudoruegeria sp. SHC-113]
MFDRLETALTRFAGGLAVLGGLGLLFATLITCLSILLKLAGRLLDPITGPLGWTGPILGEEELVTYGVGFALFAALPWAMIRRGHIRIDLFEPRFSPGFNRWLDLLADLSLAAIAYLILTRQWFQILRPARRSEETLMTEVMAGNWGVIGERLRDAQESQILGIKLWPTYIVAEACVAAFFVIACFCVLRSARALILKSGAA